MFSFLPAAYKEKVKKEYNLRVRASVCLMLGCVVLISAVLAFPAYLSAKSAQTIALANYKTAENAEAAAGGQDIDAALSKAKTYMTAFQSLSPLNADAIAAQILSAKQSGVSITSISIGDSDDGVLVSVGGVALTRSGLTAFSRALQDVANFSSVTLPVNDLAQDSNISYTISFSIKKQSQ